MSLIINPIVSTTTEKKTLFASSDVVNGDGPLPSLFLCFNNFNERRERLLKKINEISGVPLGACVRAGGRRTEGVVLRTAMNDALLVF